MALIIRGNGSGFFLSVSLTDTQGDVSTLRYELQSADYATAVTDTTAIVSALSAVTGSVVSSTSMSFVRDEDTFAFPTGADNGVRARLTFQLVNSIEKASLDIPAPQNGIFVSALGPNNNIVDIADTALVTDVQLFQAGGKSFISDGELSDFVLRGKRTTR